MPKTEQEILIENLEMDVYQLRSALSAFSGAVSRKDGKYEFDASKIGDLEMFKARNIMAITSQYAGKPYDAGTAECVKYLEYDFGQGDPNWDPLK